MIDWIKMGQEIEELGQMMVARKQNEITHSFDSAKTLLPFEHSDAEEMLIQAAGDKGIRVFPMAHAYEDTSKEFGGDMRGISAYTNFHYRHPKDIHIIPERAFINTATATQAEHFMRTGFHELGHCSAVDNSRPELAKPDEEAVAEMSAAMMFEELYPDADLTWSRDYVALYQRFKMTYPYLQWTSEFATWKELVTYAHAAYSWQRPVVMQAAKDHGLIK